MKRKIVLATALLSSMAVADPTVFNLELGVTTETELHERYKVAHAGINKFNQGNMYTVPTSAIQLEGLQDVTVVFDADEVLVAVLSTLNKSRFDYLHKTLGGKYQLISENIPFVGSSSATYRDGDTEIVLDAPHLSFSMEMNYVRMDFQRAVNEQLKREQREKEEGEASLL